MIHVNSLLPTLNFRMATQMNNRFCKKPIATVVAVEGKLSVLHRDIVALKLEINKKLYQRTGTTFNLNIIGKTQLEKLITSLGVGREYQLKAIEETAVGYLLLSRFNAEASQETTLQR